VRLKAGRESPWAALVREEREQRSGVYRLGAKQTPHAAWRSAAKGKPKPSKQSLLTDRRGRAQEPARPVHIDGEAVLPGADGISDFDGLSATVSAYTRGCFIGRKWSRLGSVTLRCLAVVGTLI
jgi:hypothetical protein